jgi:hypothetical protein
VTKKGRAKADALVFQLSPPQRASFASIGLGLSVYLLRSAARHKQSLVSGRREVAKYTQAPVKMVVASTTSRKYHLRDGCRVLLHKFHGLGERRSPFSTS